MSVKHLTASFNRFSTCVEALSKGVKGHFNLAKSLVRNPFSLRRSQLARKQASENVRGRFAQIPLETHCVESVGSPRHA